MPHAITIDKNEVLRYLGWQGQAYDEQLNALLDKTIADCLACAAPKSVLRTFPLVREAAGIALAGTPLILPGEDIQAHMCGTVRACLLAATLGPTVDSAIRRLSYTDMTASVIFNAAATVLIEAYCDDMEQAHKAEAAASGLFGNARFSPGYGDLPLTLQPGILRVLQAEKAIGLTCTPSLILTPSKSVTAVWGLFLHPPQKCATDKCARCPSAGHCAYGRYSTEKE